MTKPDKLRLIYLYAPSKEDKDRYERMAKEKGVPLSKLLIGLIEDHLHEPATPRDSAIELEFLREEMAKLVEESRRKTLLLERYEQDLQKLRAAPFAQNGYGRLRNYDPNFITVLKQGTISEPRLLELLRIDPTDAAQVRGLSRQIEALEAYGLVTKTTRGWRWIG